MSSGATCDDECQKKFEQIKMKKDLRYVIYCIEDKKTIKFEKEGEVDKTFDDFKKALPEDQPRYAVIDYPYKSEDGRDQSKLTFVFWSPDTCGVKDKMLYASSKDAIKKKLTGIMKEMQCNDEGDLDEENFNKKMLEK
ncbi:unnamed protein product [Prorocentrum cordatum]|uniref:ADF-H domain-containing protein n=1 Tax=Prorocentrum cordatum TaxID=2364126 RepID=A0ABN9Y0Q2_9DINO|nr:unnamed protein product [Polarella glacialis]|mmetsp:Transcript_57434/g.153440  ORF Transcript_57434/g.153440 Transcript_57434/m.153440 type:complete len:138 (-) Transcript_57434:67-480(-)